MTAPATPPRLVERGSWRWDDESSWVDYPTVQEAVDSLRRHGGGEVRGWLAPTSNAPQDVGHDGGAI